MNSQMMIKFKQRTQNLLLNVGKVPQLCIFQIGSRPDSNLYLRNKQLAAERVGIQVFQHQFDIGTSPKLIEEILARENANAACDGILIQLPVPQYYKYLGQLIRPEKDIDG